MKPDAGGEPVAATIADLASALARDDEAAPADDLTDALVVGIGDVDIAGTVDRDSHWVIKLGAGGGPEVAARAYCTVARDRSDGAAADLADAIVVRVRNVEVAGNVHCDAVGAIKLGAGGGSAVAAGACRTGARHRGDSTGNEIDHADAV